MEATPRATSRARINREHPVVTRHGLRSPHAATPPLQRMPQARPSPRSAQTCWISAAARSRSSLARRKISLTKLPADASAQPVPPSPQPSKTRNPHRPSPQPRGFVLGRFSYAGPMPRRATGDGRHPKTFTTSVVQRSRGGAPKADMRAKATGDVDGCDRVIRFEAAAARNPGSIHASSSSSAFACFRSSSDADQARHLQHRTGAPPWSDADHRLEDQTQAEAGHA